MSTIRKQKRITSRVKRKRFTSAHGVPFRVPGKRAYHNPVDRRDILERAAAYERRIAYLEALAKGMRSQAKNEKGNPNEPQALAMRYLIELNELYRNAHGAFARAFTLDHFWHPKNIQPGIEAAGRIGKATEWRKSIKSGKFSKEKLKMRHPDLFSDDPTGVKWAAAISAKTRHIKSEEQERAERPKPTPSQESARAMKAANTQVETLVRWLREKKWSDAQTMITNLRQLADRNPFIRKELMNTILPSLREAQSAFSSSGSSDAARILREAIQYFSPERSAPARAASADPIATTREGIGMRTPTKSTRSPAQRAQKRVLSREPGPAAVTPRPTTPNTALPLQLTPTQTRLQTRTIAHALRENPQRLIRVLSQRVEMLRAAGKATTSSPAVRLEPTPIEETSSAVPAKVMAAEKDLSSQGALRERFYAHSRATQKDIRDLIAIARRAGKIYLRMQRQGKTATADLAMRTVDDAIRAYEELLYGRAR